MDFQPNPHAGLFSNFLQTDPDVNLNDLDKLIKKRMILWPRGTFKTSAVRAAIIQLILCYPNIRILILSGARNLASLQLERIKEFFENPTEKFRELYPEFCGQRLGNKSQFTIPNRTLRILAEPTVSISTGRSVKAGSHFDVIFVDDLVNDQNYQSIESLEKCWVEYKNIGPLLQPAGYLFVTGTRYSFGDTYERIKEAAEAEQKETGRTVWKISTRTCWKTINGKREVLFPEFVTRDGRTEGHTVEYLESERREKGDEFFACQYENDPIASGTQTFTQELLDKQTIYHLNQVPQQGFTFAVGDLSYVGDERNGHLRDRSVMFILRAAEGRLTLFDCIHGKWDSNAVALNVLFALLKHRLNMIWIEGFLGWEAYDNVIRSMAVGRGIQRLPLEWLPLSNVNEYKKVIIGSAKSWLAQDKLKMFAGIPEFETLTTQLLRWPKLGRHDDFANCLGLACNVPHGVALERIPQSIKTMQDKVNRLHFPEGDPRFISPADEHIENYPMGKCGTGLVCG